jgi:pimeloyl-ACP methyl ester carboxylesterase
MTTSPIEFKGSEGNRLAGDLRDGRGHPVILLHGGGQTRRAWDETARRLAAAGMRAITVDQRGHGDSDWVESRRYAFDDFALDLVEVARDVARRFHAAPSIVGASLGGISALAAETRHGPLFESIVLVDVTPRMDAGGVDRIHHFMSDRMHEGYGTLAEAADAIAAFMPTRKRPNSLDGLRKNLRQGADGRFRWHWDPALVGGEHSIRVRAMERMESLLEALPSLHLPVLLVRGMQSELVHEEHAREFVSLAPMASYVDVGGAGHMVAGDRNDVFCDAVMAFLTDREAA